MRMLGIREAIERAKELMSGGDDDEPGSKGRFRGWHSTISVTTAVIAVVGALIGLFETMLIADMIHYKNEALLRQSKASDQWSYFQAKTIRHHMFEMNAKLFPSHRAEFIETAARYERERTEIRKMAEKYESEVNDNNNRSERYHHLHLFYATGVTAFQVSIALLAVSAYTRSKGLWLVAMLISLTGLGSVAAGFVL